MRMAGANGTARLCFAEYVTSQWRLSLQFKARWKPPFYELRMSQYEAFHWIGVSLTCRFLLQKMVIGL